jgi:type II secretory pathway predicted ATPase ExeA
MDSASPFAALLVGQPTLAHRLRQGVFAALDQRSSVRYSVTDPRIFELLEVAKAILTSTLAESGQLLVELESLEFVERPDPPPRRKAAR